MRGGSLSLPRGSSLPEDFSSRQLQDVAPSTFILPATSNCTRQAGGVCQFSLEVRKSQLMNVVLLRIKRAVLAGYYRFSERALIELEGDGLSKLDVVESISTSAVIYKFVQPVHLVLGKGSICTL